MWMGYLSGNPTLTFDLQDIHPLQAVRIWNFNPATARHRLDSGSVPYLVVNVAGAALILFWIWQREQAPGILVWVTWAAIFLVLAVRLIRRT